MHFLGKEHFDILFTIQDHFIMEQIAPYMKQIQQARLENFGKTFKWIGYWPIDSQFVKENWVKVVGMPDFPILYTDFGLDTCLDYDSPEMNLEKRASVIYHGIDPAVFHPIDDDEKAKFRAEYFDGKVKPTDFLVTNVSRNQPRKDIARTIRIFAEFNKVRPQSKLYLHMQHQDAGGSIKEMCRAHYLNEGEHYIVPENMTTHQGFPVEALNKIYNVSDICLTTTLGEGFGFIVPESMATKTLIMAPNHTAITELIGPDEERGILIPAGQKKSDWFCLGFQDKEIMRPLADVEYAVQKLIDVYDNQAAYTPKVAAAYDWIKQYSWDEIAKQWEKVFRAAEEANAAEQKLVANREQLSKPNRHERRAAAALQRKGQ
jgi:glycosyltransferase involved in cell wall biosynthesis